MSGISINELFPVRMVLENVPVRMVLENVLVRKGSGKCPGAKRFSKMSWCEKVLENVLYEKVLKNNL